MAGSQRTARGKLSALPTGRRSGIGPGLTNENYGNPRLFRPYEVPAPQGSIAAALTDPLPVPPPLVIKRRRKSRARRTG